MAVFPSDAVCGGRSLLHLAGVQQPLPEVYGVPAQRDQYLNPQSMPVGKQDQGGIPSPHAGLGTSRRRHFPIFGYWATPLFGPHGRYIAGLRHQDLPIKGHLWVFYYVIRDLCGTTKLGSDHHYCVVGAVRCAYP